MLAWKWKRRMVCLQGTSWCNNGITNNQEIWRIFLQMINIYSDGWLMTRSFPTKILSSVLVSLLVLHFCVFRSTIRVPNWECIPNGSDRD